MVNSEKPVTASEVRGIVEETLEKFAVRFLKPVFDRYDKWQKAKELEDRQNWKEQREFNKRIEKKVGLLDQSVQVLDKRVKYQKDMPQRLEKVENDTYDLKRRVGKIEERAGLTKF